MVNKKQNTKLSFIRIYFFLFTVLICIFCRSATTVDSLICAINRETNDSCSLSLKNELCRQYFNVNIDSSLLLVHEVLQKTNKLGIKTEFGRACCYKGYLCMVTGKTDSCSYYLQKAQEILEQSNSPLFLAQTYSFIAMSVAFTDFEKSEKAFQKAINIQREKGFIKDLSNSIHNLGYLYLKYDKYAGALELYRESLQYDVEIGDSSNIPITLLNIGEVYAQIHHLEKAVQNYFEALELFEKTNNKMGIARTMNNIGEIYIEQNLYAKAGDFFSRSLKIKKELNDIEGISNTFMNLGFVHFKLNNCHNAKVYLNKADKLYKELSNNIGLTNANILLGEIHLATMEYDSAKICFLNSYKIAQITKQSSAEAKSLINLSRIYVHEDRIKKSVDQLEKALNIAQGIGHLEYIAMCYKMLSEVYEEQQKYHLAYANAKKYIFFSDSLSKVENRRNLSELQIKYETERKEQELVLMRREEEISALTISRQKVKIKTQSTLRKALIAGIVLILVILLMVFNRLSDRIISKSKE